METTTWGAETMFSPSYRMNEAEGSDSAGEFLWQDYLVFGSMLALSAGIGIFFGIKDRKKQDTTEFLMAGKSMGTFPIAMSLVASFMSAITLLGTLSEVYKYGTLYWLIGFSYFLVMPAAAYLYLPVFVDLQVTSAYEYLEIRFPQTIQLLGSGVFILQMVLYMSIVVYAPALALEQVTVLDAIIFCALICFVCIFYTTIGCMKESLWTDTAQVILVYVSMMMVIFKGMIDKGGFMEVWQKNVDGGCVELIIWDQNPITRHSLWSLIIGGYFTWLATYGCNQAQIQRYLSVRKASMAVHALWVNLFALFFLMILCAYGGMVIYAHYDDCDPISNNQIRKSDQLMPLCVMDTLGKCPVLPGLFVAGIFLGALSMVSSGTNSLAAIVLEDFLQGWLWPKISMTQATWVSKDALDIFGKIGGHLLGLVSLGMFFIWENYKVALAGMITSLVSTCWIGFRKQSQKFHRRKFGIRYCGSMYSMRALLGLFLVNLVIGGVQSHEISEDCRVKASMDLCTIHKNSWIAYLKNNTDLNILVAYNDRNELSDSDVIYISLNRIYREKSRNREITVEELSLNQSLPLGWSDFSTAVVNDLMKLTINSLHLTIKLDYPVRFISVTSELMASCSEGKPTWEVTKGKNATVPTEELGDLQFFISSNKSFSPVIYVNEASIIFQYNSGVEISYHNKQKPLPRNTYEFMLQRKEKRLSLLCKKNNSVFEVILEAKMTGEFFNMVVSSLDEDFILKINPSKSIYVNNTDPSSKNENGSTASIYIFCHSLAGISIGVILIISVIYIYKKIMKQNTKNENNKRDYHKLESSPIARPIIEQAEDFTEEEDTKTKIFLDMSKCPELAKSKKLRTMVEKSISDLKPQDLITFT